MKKFFVLVLVAVMVTLVVSACGEVQEEGREYLQYGETLHYVQIGGSPIREVVVKRNIFGSIIATIDANSPISVSYLPYAIAGGLTAEEVNGRVAIDFTSDWELIK